MDFVRLENRSEIADSVVCRRACATSRSGKRLDVETVEQAMNKVYGLEYYQNVRYGLVTEPTARRVSRSSSIRARGGRTICSSAWSTAPRATRMRCSALAASYLAHGDQRARRRVARDVRHRRRARAWSPISISRSASEGLYFVAPTLDIGSTIFNVYDGDQLLTEARVRESRVEFGVGRELPSWGEIRVGVRAGGRRGRGARRRSDARSGRGLYGARDVVRALRRRHDGQRGVSARRHTRKHRVARLAARLGVRRRGFRSAAAVRGARQDLGTSHGRCPRFATTRPSAAKHRSTVYSGSAAFSISRASTRISSPASMRCASAGATTGASATSRYSRRSPA